MNNLANQGGAFVIRLHVLPMKYISPVTRHVPLEFRLLSVWPRHVAQEVFVF